MLKEQAQAILDDWTKKLNKEQAIIKVFEKVRDIPYGVINSRDPFKVYSENKGTCSGKHFLLAALYRAMGLNVKDMISFHKYENLPRNVEYTKELQRLLQLSDGIPDYHNFIKIDINKKWLTIDATFEKDLRDYFIVNEWNGKDDMRLTVDPVTIWEVKDPLEFKIKKLGELPLKKQNDRREFLSKFTSWLDVLKISAKELEL
jgi:hypothetical protein